MKKNFYVFTAIFLFSFAEGLAQLPTYLARTTQAMTAVMNKAAQDGYTNPNLVGVGTLKGEFDAGLLGTIKNEFNLGNEMNSSLDADRGEARAWAYLIRSSAKTDTKLYLAVNTGLFGYQVFDAPNSVDLSTIPATFNKSLPNSGGTPTWINSDSVVLALRTNATYMQYRLEYPDTTPNFAALGYSNAATQNFPADSPLWTMIFQGNGAQSMSCFVHALTKQTECIRASSTGVEENIFSGENFISPNPARDFVNISIPEKNYSTDGKIEIFSSLGEKIYSLNMNELGAGYTIALSTEKYSAGIYYVRYSGNSLVKNFSFVVEK